MGGESEFYPIVESKLFHEQLEQLIQGLRIDRQALNIVLSGLRWALGTNPTVYPKVPETKSLYVAKTSRRKCPTGEVPMLRIFYAINEDGSVELLSIETMDLFL